MAVWKSHTVCTSLSSYKQGLPTYPVDISASILLTLVLRLIIDAKPAVHPPWKLQKQNQAPYKHQPSPHSLHRAIAIIVCCSAPSRRLFSLSEHPPRSRHGVSAWLYITKHVLLISRATLIPLWPTQTLASLAMGVVLMRGCVPVCFAPSPDDVAARYRWTR